MNNLSAFFQPHAIAIIGASREPGKLGHDVIRNLLDFAYQGAIYPVNPRADEILGLPVYAAIDDLPEVVDLAVIVVPAPYVADSLEACGQHKIHAAIVVSGGFREAGAEGALREKELQAIAQKYNIALLGPNCIGVIDNHNALNTTFVKGRPPTGNIAFISQSGAIVASVIDWAEKQHIGFSRMVSLGNQAGVTETELLASLADDPNTKVATLYMEGLQDGRAFVDMATQVNIPIIAIKSGRGAGGAKAAASHTGALAGSESAYEAAFRRAGILRANTLEQLLDWASAFAMQTLPRGNRVAVITNAGGHGILATDSLEAAGLQLAPLMPETKAYLRENLHPAASVHNPVDILAGSKPPQYKLCIEALLQDETVDAIAILTAPQDWFDPLDLADVIVAANQRDIPILTSIMGLEADSPAKNKLREGSVPNYEFPERIGSALGAMWQYRQYLSSRNDETSTLPDVSIENVALTSDDKWLPAEQVTQLLNAYHIPTPKSALVHSIDEALRVNINFPVAMKLQVKGISHKTDIGGVLLNIDSQERLKEAFSELQNRVPEDAQFEGVLLQEMVFGQLEVIVGLVRDPIFGAMLMVGSGGTQVELLRDVAFELAPLTRKQAQAMLARTSLAQLMSGYRGQPTLDHEALIDIMQLLSQIALDHPQISEIEVNPLIVSQEGAVVVDARVATGKKL